MRCPKCGKELHNKYNLCLECDFSSSDNSYKVDTNNITELYKAARQAKSNGDTNQAVKFYSLILQKKPDDWEAEFYSKTENYDGADSISSMTKTLEDGTVVYKMAVEKEEKEAKSEKWITSYDKKKKRNRIMGIVVIALIIALIIYGIASLFSGGSNNEYDDVMAGYDWGDHQYYDRNSHRVETKPWK